KPEQLAAALKKRIDPKDLYNVTIRPVSSTRVEIILPTGGARQSQRAEAAWKEVLTAVENSDKYRDKLGGEKLTASRGNVDRLAADAAAKIDARQWAALLK